MPIRLGSISNTLDDLAARMSALVEEHLDDEDEDIVRSMEEIERAMRSGARRLQRLVREVERRV